MSNNVSQQITKKLKTMSNLSQIAQVVVNLEHFCVACEELEGVLMHLRYVVASLFSEGFIHSPSTGHRSGAVQSSSSRSSRSPNLYQPQKAA